MKGALLFGMLLWLKLKFFAAACSCCCQQVEFISALKTSHRQSSEKVQIRSEAKLLCCFASICAWFCVQMICVLPKFHHCNLLLAPLTWTPAKEHFAPSQLGTYLRLRLITIHAHEAIKSASVRVKFLVWQTRLFLLTYMEQADVFFNCTLCPW